MAQHRRDPHWLALALRARQFPSRPYSRARAPCSRPRRAPFCLAALGPARLIDRARRLPRRPRVLSRHRRGAVGFRHTRFGTKLRIGLAFAMKFVFERPDACLHAVELLDQLFVGRWRGGAPLRCRFLSKRGVPCRGQKGHHGKRGDQTSVSCCFQCMERGPASNRHKHY